MWLALKRAIFSMLFAAVVVSAVISPAWATVSHIGSHDIDVVHLDQFAAEAHHHEDDDHHQRQAAGHHVPVGQHTTDQAADHGRHHNPADHVHDFPFAPPLVVLGGRSTPDGWADSLLPELHPTAVAGLKRPPRTILI